MLKLGELELLVVLSILRNPDEPYANQIRQDLEENANRRIARGALYRTIDRLEAKGLIRWELEPSSVPERGGHPMRRLHVTANGLEAARTRRSILRRFFKGLDLSPSGGR